YIQGLPFYIFWAGTCNLFSRKKRTFPFFSNFSTAILTGLTFFAKILKHRIVISLKFFITFPDLVSYSMVRPHFPKFFKLPVKIESYCRYRTLPGFSGAVGM